MTIEEVKSEEGILLERCLGGDVMAFEALFHRYYDMIYGLIYKHCGNAHDAEDIVQEAFIKAARAISGFRGEASFKNWMCRIALNQAEDHRRKGSRRAELLEQYSHPEASSLLPEASAQMNEALQKLSEKERAAVLLVFDQEMSHAEAAEACNCSETTISWRIFVAKRKLKSLLSERKPS